MTKLSALLLAASLATAASPALAQTDQHMMGDHGQGMMGGDYHGQGMMGGPGKANCPRVGKGMMGGGMMQGGMMGHGVMAKDMMHSRPMMEAHIAYIKADLDITDAQMDEWNAYADAVRKRHAAMESVWADMMKAKGGTAVERLDARITSLEARLESLKAMKPATEGLYAVLTDAQKEKADKLLGGGCHMM
jgi:opacity protein-like surface antigen